MYVCMYAGMLCAYVCMYVCRYVQCMHMYMYMSTYLYMYACVYYIRLLYVRTDGWMDEWMDVCVCGWVGYFRVYLCIRWVFVLSNF